jgi:hypothetical protein
LVVEKEQKFHGLDSRKGEFDLWMCRNLGEEAESEAEDNIEGGS